MAASDLEFWHCPEGDSPMLVDTPEKLDEVEKLAETALVCGIDCE